MMADRHFSIFRGKAKSGLGEGPGSQVGLGEQYLGADPEVFTESICANARPWLTLDAPEQVLTDRLESWSCFASDGLLFVARMQAVRVAFDPRPTYFTHARAFPLSDALALRDPGAYLGVSAAFDAPWLPEARAPLSPLPPLETPRPAAGEWEVATNLLGHMYQAFVRGYPVVIAASPSDCTIGGRLFSLVAYARAALPWSIKREYRARLFTREARLFLRQLGANLLVIPESAAAEALEARRDTLLLDAKAGVIRGQPLGAQARAYAEALRTSVEKLPLGLLPFAARVSEHLPAGALPSAHGVLIAQAIYNLAAAGSGQMDSLFRFLLTRLSAQASAELPFDRILREEEMRAVSDARLAETLMYGTAGEHVSPSAEALMRVAAAEARTRRMTVDENVRALSEPTTGTHLQKMAWLAREKVLSPAAMAEKTAALALARVAEIMDPAEALGHERDARVLNRRESAVDDLSLWADRDAAVRDLLFGATAGGVLSDRWLILCIERATVENLIRIGTALLDRDGAEPRLTAALNRLLSRLPTADPASLRALRPSLEAAARRSDPVAATARYMELSLLLHSSGGVPTAVQQTWQQNFGRIRDTNLRRWIIQQTGEMGGIWGDDNGVLLIPSTWDRDVAPLILANASLRKRLSFGAVARLARSVSPSDPGFAEFIAEADREANSDLTRATSVLVNESVWQTWRSATRLQVNPRACARAWLCASHSARHEAPTIDEWRSVLSDLKDTLEDADVQVLVQRNAAGKRRACWPWIAPYEREQIRGLAELAANLSHVVEIAHAVDVSRDPKHRDDPAGAFRTALGVALDASRFSGKIRVDVLHWLARPELDVLERWPLGSGELRAIFSIDSAMRERALNLKLPMPDTAVHDAATWLAEQPSIAGVDEAFLRRLHAWIQARGGLPELANLTPRPDLASQLRKTFPGLARLVDPPRGRRLYDAVVKALAEGDEASPRYEELSAEIKKWSSEIPASRGLHPLRQLAEAIRDIPFGSALDTRGESAFLNVCSWQHGLLDLTAGEGARLPALDILLALVPSESELQRAPNKDRPPGNAGAVACRFIATLINAPQLHSFLDRDDFWRALFASLSPAVRRTACVDHRPANAVVEIRRLGPALAPWRARYDAVMKGWLQDYKPGRMRITIPSFPRVSSTGA